MPTIKKKSEVETGDGFSIYFSKLLKPGITIVDITGYITNAFGSEPVFKLYHLILSNGEKVCIEGEHDLPYLDNCKAIPNGQLKALNDEDDENENDEDNQ